MESSGIAILVLIGLVLIVAAVLGIWIAVLRRQLATQTEVGCMLRQELAAYQRDEHLAAKKSHLEGLTDAELAEYHFPGRHPDLDDGTG